MMYLLNSELAIFLQQYKIHSTLFETVMYTRTSGNRYSNLGKKWIGGTRGIFCNHIFKTRINLHYCTKNGGEKEKAEIFNRKK